MNIESTTTPVKTTSETTDASKSAKNTSNTFQNEESSFKKELEAVKETSSSALHAEENPAKQGTVQENNKMVKDTDKNTTLLASIQNQKQLEGRFDINGNPISELEFEIQNLNSMKNFQFLSKTKESKSTNVDFKELPKEDYCQTIKMDKNDAQFFLSLVQNEQMSVQGNKVNQELQLNTQSVAKSEGAQAIMHVSETLMNALSEAMKTNKPCRIDFDNNIAVIMRVDKNGVLTANFIPGDAAVENYLRNNIASLRQSFDNQNLAYNELTYSKQNNKNQQEKQQNKEKENE